MFEKPAATTGIQWADYKGRLLLVEPHGFETAIPTSNGPRDAVRATVTVLDGPDAPIEFRDALIFPKLLVSQTRSMIGHKVLGRLGQGQAKPGQNPPWKLDDFTDADMATATAYVQRRDQNQFSAPAQSEPPF